MKRFLILLIGLLTAIAPLSAANAGKKNGNGKPNVRLEWGLTAAAYYNMFKIDDAKNISVKSPMSVGAGLHMSLNFGRFFAIQPEINYQYQKFNVRTDKAQKNIKVTGHSVDIPILLSLRIANVVRFNAGPMFTIMNSYHYDTDRGERVMYGNARPTFGYSAGVAVLLRRRFMIDARYIGYFKQSLNHVEGEEFNGQLSSISLKLGFLF